jgi:hypothetical protein
LLTAQREWIDRSEITHHIKVHASDGAGQEYIATYNDSKGWVLIKGEQVVFSPGYHDFIDFFDNKPKDIKMYYLADS